MCYLLLPASEYNRYTPSQMLHMAPNPLDGGGAILNSIVLPLDYIHGLGKATGRYFVRCRQDPLG